MGFIVAFSYACVMLSIHTVSQMLLLDVLFRKEGNTRHFSTYHILSCLARTVSTQNHSLKTRVAPKWSWSFVSCFYYLGFICDSWLLYSWHYILVEWIWRLIKQEDSVLIFDKWVNTESELLNQLANMVKTAMTARWGKLIPRLSSPYDTHKFSTSFGS